MKTKHFRVGVGLLVMFFFSQAFAEDVAYHIGPGDVLEISVWKEPDLSRDVVVPPDGIISFPLVDALDVNNMTVSQLKKRVSSKLAEFIPDVTVTVMIKQINSLQAYVIGKVKSPGEYVIGLDTTVMQILAKAKGLTPFASKEKILILRRNGDNLLKIPFDYDEVEKGRDLRQNILLQAGDVVVVP